MVLLGSTRWTTQFESRCRQHRPADEHKFVVGLTFLKNKVMARNTSQHLIFLVIFSRLLLCLEETIWDLKSIALFASCYYPGWDWQRERGWVGCSVVDDESAPNFRDVLLAPANHAASSLGEDCPSRGVPLIFLLPDLLKFWTQNCFCNKHAANPKSLLRF